MDTLSIDREIYQIYPDLKMKIRQTNTLDLLDD
jgi:hypothetical protein